MMIGILIPLLLLIPIPAKAEVEGELFDHSAFDISHMGHSFPTGEWVQKLRDYESRKKRIPVDEMLNNSLLELEWEEDGSYGSTESEELLQLPSNQD